MRQRSKIKIRKESVCGSIYVSVRERKKENNTVDKFYEKEQSVRLHDIDKNNNKYRIVINK